MKPFVKPGFGEVDDVETVLGSIELKGAKDGGAADVDVICGRVRLLSALILWRVSEMRLIK